MTREFKVGDWVKITNQELLFLGLKGQLKGQDLNLSLKWWVEVDDGPWMYCNEEELAHSSPDLIPLTEEECRNGYGKKVIVLDTDSLCDEQKPYIGMTGVIEENDDECPFVTFTNKFHAFDFDQLAWAPEEGKPFNEICKDVKQVADGVAKTADGYEGISYTDGGNFYPWRTNQPTKPMYTYNLKRVKTYSPSGLLTDVIQIKQTVPATHEVAYMDINTSEANQLIAGIKQLTEKE